MATIKLNNAEKVTATINNVPKTKEINGRKVVSYSNFIKLVPGVEHQTDDEAMITFFKNYKRKVRYNSQLEEALKANNVPYEIEYCKSCGGKIKKISYHLVEVTE